MEFKEIIKNLRKSKGFSADYVAQQIDIPAGSYKKYESGILNPGVPVIIKLADFYGVTTDYLLGREPPNDPFEMLGLDTSSKNVVEEFAGLPDDSRKFILDIVIKLAHAAEGKSGEVSAPDYGPMRHSATYEELKRGSDAEAKKNA